MSRRPSLVAVGLTAWSALLLAVATVATAYVARTTAVGPTLVRFGHGHGIHVGDVVVAIIAYGAAAVGSGTAAGFRVLQIRERATKPLGA